MIARISGKVVEKDELGVVVDVGGLGYRVVVGSSVLSRVAEGDVLTVRTYHHITDSGQALYGFEDSREEKYFRLLLSVPSVGARTARSILNTTPPDVLEQAVAYDDVGLLTKVPGVGKRTAERIIVELKEKLLPPTTRSVAGVLQEDVAEALLSLGFSRRDAQKALDKLPKEVESVEEAVKLSLKQSGQ